MKTLSSTQLAQLDGHIFHKEILGGIQFLCASLGIRLKEALEHFSERYEELRKSKADQFTHSHEEYWKDFYS